MLNNYAIISVLFLLVICIASVYVFRYRKSLDEMHGMMAGMTLGMISGLVASTLFLIPTGNFLYGFIIGTVIGLFFGIFFGKLGGHLGIMEGIIAGPMGGMMGAMLGQMVRPFNIEIFMPFFAFIFLIIIFGLSYTINCKAGCCRDEASDRHFKISKCFFVIWAIAAIILLSFSTFMDFSILEKSSLPPVLQDAINEEKVNAVMNGNYQEVDLRITGTRYFPNIIVAKKGILLKINARADKNAGCAQEIVFPDFNIDRIIPAGTSSLIELMPDKEGIFVFRCSMDMVHGKLLVIA